MRVWVRTHPVLSFYVLAYVYSWTIMVPLALQARGLFLIGIPKWLHYFSAFGPGLAALTLTCILRERKNGESTHARDYRVAWLAMALFSPLLLFEASRLLGWLFDKRTPGWSELGHLNFVPDLGIAAWFLWLLTSGFGEEIGWRGFVLPRLQKTHSARTSSLSLGLVWGCWHLPAFLYVPSYAAIGVRMIPVFFIGILAGSIVLTWLYNSSGGCTLAAVLWHASFNFVTASPNSSGLTAAFISTVVILWALAIIWLCSAETLANRSVRADRHEHTMELPGDELIENPVASLTHAITIACSRAELWKWLVQMGAGRAGWYSYDFIDNGRHRSADRILREYQSIKPGQLMPAMPGITDAFNVVRFEPQRFIVIGCILPDRTLQMTWTFALQEESSCRTRLIVRARGAQGAHFYGLPSSVARLVLPAIHFVMERKQLLNIAMRGEATHLAAV